MFSSYFVAMKHNMETVSGLIYKLSTMIVTLSRNSYIYGDNVTVIPNNQIPEPTLKNNGNSIFIIQCEIQSQWDIQIQHISP